MWQEILTEIGKLSFVTGPVVIGFVAAVAAVVAAVVGPVITAIVSKLYLGARDKQDRETEWRKLAVELTKLDLERKLACRLPNDTTPIRPVILDFLANYRDLSELGKRTAGKKLTPGELYEKIKADRISQIPSPSPQDAVGSVEAEIVKLDGPVTVPPASSTPTALP